MSNAATKIAPKPRFTIQIVPREPIAAGVQAASEALAYILNNPAHRDHGLEGIYAIESATVIVWRTA